jgi:hypothetical protein
MYKRAGFLEYRKKNVTLRALQEATNAGPLTATMKQSDD